MKPQEARNAMVNLEFVTAEEAIHTLADMFGAAEVARIAREHGLAIFHANTFMGCIAPRNVVKNAQGQIIGQNWDASYGGLSEGETIEPA